VRRISTFAFVTLSLAAVAGCERRSTENPDESADAEDFAPAEEDYAPTEAAAGEDEEVPPGLTARSRWR
jgi:hypothetical protein